MGYLLEPVGLSETDNRVLLAVVTAPQATPAELADQLGISASGVRRALGNLVAAGLVTKLVVRPPRYVPAPPDVAVDALVARRQQELEQLRADARELATRVRQTPGRSPADLLEVLEGSAAIQQQMAQIQLGAREEVLMVDAPPYIHGQPVPNLEELQALKRGVSYRCVYEGPALELPGHFEQLLMYVRAGEEARTLPVTAMKMQIVDRRIAILPLSLDPAETGMRLLVRASPLLEALVRCFESMWEQATPVAAMAGDGPAEPDTVTRRAREQRRTAKGPSGLSDRDRRLLTLMAAGMKDRVIARTMGVTQRTISRQVAELMADLGAETRFQAGLEAMRRGWL
ncbi:helix-turn-helix transcriptional regulator [Kribbella sp. CA-294648]|uniref:helix-turn-helix transcriptional regulator n=1 Tax=Kribbella sp. CA-294648 TaxID=3239948 RepID=UPI003D937C9E